METLTCIISAARGSDGFTIICLHLHPGDCRCFGISLISKWLIILLAGKFGLDAEEEFLSENSGYRHTGSPQGSDASTTALSYIDVLYTVRGERLHRVLLVHVRTIVVGEFLLHVLLVVGLGSLGVCGV